MELSGCRDWVVEIMIKVYCSPQVSERQIEYFFNGEAATAKIGDVEDTFDFSGLPDGELNMEELIETTLPVCPIISAKRVDGVLHLELLNWIDSDAPYESRFPAWVELPLPERVGKGKEPEHLAVIPWRTKQEIWAAKQAARAEAQEREDRRDRIKTGLTTARTQDDLLALVRDMAAEMGFVGQK